MTLNPNQEMVVGADGRVTMQFTGHVHATGLDLDAAPGIHSSVASQRVSWARTNDGALVAQVYAYGDDAVGGVAGAIAQNADGSRGAQLTAFAGPIGESAQFTRVEAAAQGIAKKLIGGDGASDFLQLLLGGKVRLAHGTQAVRISNGLNQGTLDVDTGLGSTPLRVWANARNNPPLLVSGAKVAAVTNAGHLTLQAYTANLATVAADIDITCDWFALG